ncbi:hypothetical protein [Comamonas sp. 26]|uniref:hypothetical protein n=1 Tax=Comamonas sp. 26 TaxID=2035201 RepID=UPI000C49F145|nr:hypothetical protein [Comamonas sp. 26]PIG09624.1 hypothetical protein CLU84_2554 [Comamonas sp. 26]
MRRFLLLPGLFLLGWILLLLLTRLIGLLPWLILVGVLLLLAGLLLIGVLLIGLLRHSVSSFS